MGNGSPTPADKIDIHARTRLLIGDAGMARLAAARVAVIGLGGVGSAAAEQLCRAGVGHLTLVDFDAVRESNLNRQLFALRSTLGRPKAEVAAERLADIDPGCVVDARVAFFAADTAADLALAGQDHVLDCIDSLNPKAQLIHHCVKGGVPVITSTGAAAKTDPSGVTVRDLFETRNCPLARHLRRRLRNLGITAGVPAVHSPAVPQKAKGREPEEDLLPRGRPRIPLGSISYVPVLFGCLMAGHVVQHLLGATPAGD
ncbi:MAG TPA: tRNA threonylcarbamoyladenosine dehydratase [Deferrisomatales bacterium]|nr:tRNA threonylcarbamoyladenosine dehydratase [Deferrisomatales bacterium]